MSAQDFFWPYSDLLGKANHCKVYLWEQFIWTTRKKSDLCCVMLMSQSLPKTQHAVVALKRILFLIIVKSVWDLSELVFGIGSPSYPPSLFNRCKIGIITSLFRSFLSEWKPQKNCLNEVGWCNPLDPSLREGFWTNPQTYPLPFISLMLAMRH